VDDLWPTRLRDTSPAADWPDEPAWPVPQSATSLPEDAFEVPTAGGWPIRASLLEELLAA